MDARPELGGATIPQADDAKLGILSSQRGPSLLERPEEEESPVRRESGDRLGQ